MLLCLDKVNMDNNTVGWYQCSMEDSYVNATTISTQYQFQVEFGTRCICLVFDPIRTTRGKIAIKALRLTSKFIKLVKDSIASVNREENGLPANAVLSFEDALISQELLAKLNVTSDDIFEELPIKIQNSSLVEAFLVDIQVCNKMNTF